MIWKPAEYAAASARALFELVVRGGGLPDGVLNLVLADGDETFSGLETALDQGCLDKVGFTGSSKVGARIGELTGRHLQSACLELGGKNPMVVAPSADIDLAVAAALFSGFGTAGQRCTSLGTVIVHEDVREEFTGKLDQATRQAAVGDPFRDVVYGPMLNARFGRRFEEYLSWIQPHHRLLGSTGIGRITARNPREGFIGDPEAGTFYHPVIVAALREEDALFREETFGPLIGLTGYRDLGRGDPARQRARLRAVVVHLHPGPVGGLPVPPRQSAREWSASTTPPPARKPTCRSAATASPATGRASPASGCLTSSPAGSR